MGRWERRRLRLKKDHGWTSEKDCQIFVADRGAVRFDFPRKWLVIPDPKGTIKFHDRKPPDDDCTLQLTVMYLRDDIDWSGLDLAMLVGKLSAEDSREVLERGEVQHFKRGGMDVAWIEIKFLDPVENREAIGARSWPASGTSSRSSRSISGSTTPPGSARPGTSCSRP